MHTQPSILDVVCIEFKKDEEGLPEETLIRDNTFYEFSVIAVCVRWVVLSPILKLNPPP